MGVIEDVRKVIQDLVAPELKSLAVEVRAGRDESKLRDELILTKLELRMDALTAKMDAQYLSIMNALDLTGGWRRWSGTSSRLRPEVLPVAQQGRVGGPHLT